MEKEMVYSAEIEFTEFGNQQEEIPVWIIDRVNDAMRCGATQFVTSQSEISLRIEGWESKQH